MGWFGQGAEGCGTAGPSLPEVPRGEARYGKASWVAVGRGELRLGKARFHYQSFWHGSAWQGWVRRGKVWQGSYQIVPGAGRVWA